LKDNFESRFCAMEQLMKLQHSLLQTTFDNRMCALEEKQHETLKVQDNIQWRLTTSGAENVKFHREIERRISANEEVMASVPELQELNRQHTIDKREMKETTASIELRLHCLEEGVSCLSDGIFKDKEDIKQLHLMLAGEHAVTRRHTQDTIQKVGPEKKLTTGSNAPFDQRLMSVESNIDLIVTILSGMATKVAGASNSDGTDSMLAMPSEQSTSPQIQAPSIAALRSTAEEVAHNGHATLNPKDDLHQDSDPLLRHGCYTILEC